MKSEKEIREEYQKNKRQISMIEKRLEKGYNYGLSEMKRSCESFRDILKWVLEGKE